MTNERSPLRRRSIAASATGFFLAAALVGCTATAAAPSATSSAAVGNPDRPTGEVHVLVLGDAAAAAEQAAADRFNKTSDIKVVVDKGATSGNEYSTSVRNSIGTKSAPDIFMSWGSANIKPLIDAQALMPLDGFISQDPKLKDSFLPAVFNEEVVDGKSYGIPMRGVAPTFIFYNKKVLADAGLQPASNWDELLTQAATLKGKGVIPISLAGADKWPTQMWYQYAFARSIGNAEVAKGLAGDNAVWASDGSKKALEMLKGLVDTGAFGKNFGSVTYATDGSPALVRTGKAAYELMGTWYYADVTAGKDAVAENIGWVAFPSVTGGGGQAGEIAGNLSNYYNVAADTRYPDTVRAFLAQLYGEDFLNDQMGLGNLPPTTNAADLIQKQTKLSENRKGYLTFITKLVGDAPMFQLSWDQAVPAASQSIVQNAMADYFNGSIDAAQWIATMQSATKPS